MTGTPSCPSLSFKVVDVCLAPLSNLRMIGLPATPQNTLTHHLVTLSYSHTIVAKWTQTAYSHAYTHIHLCQNEHTPLRQIWHPPPVVTFLQPPPPSMGAIPVTVGCVRCGKSAKKLSSFPSKLGGVVVCCCANVLRGSLLMPTHGEAQQGSSRRGLEYSAGSPHVSVCSVQVTGHASWMLQFVLIIFTFSEIILHFHKTFKTKTQT